MNAGSFVVVEGVPPELTKHLLTLARKYPGVKPDEVLVILHPLFPRATYTELGDVTGKLRSTDVGHLAWLRKRRTNEATRRAGRKSLGRRNQRINMLMRLVEATPAPANVGPCHECGARTSAQRAIWCVSGCPWPPSRKERILAELRTWKFPIRDMRHFRPLVPKTGPDSALGWLPEIASRLAEYLVPRVTRNRWGEALKPDGVTISRIVSHILQHAAADRRITPEMVRARLARK